MTAIRHVARSGFKIPAIFLAVLYSMFVSACSIPIFEKPGCAEARDSVKQFYSFHFGNGMTPSEENLLQRKIYLTDELFGSLSQAPLTRVDYFTASENYPRAFRVGACEANAPNNPTFRVLLFWRDDTKSEQKEIRVEMLKPGSRWLINKVSK